MSKRFVLNADEFGMSKANNRAVLEGYNNGFLSSASICANGKAFNAAVNEILPECPDLGVGVHLNIVSGKSLTKADMLTDKKDKFKTSFLNLWLNSKNDKLLYQIEQEFRVQIETVKKYALVDHINSNKHIHAIPAIFEIVCKLAKEYEIPVVRTHYEEFYLVSGLKKHFTFSYPINVIKLILLAHFTKVNKITASKYNVKTNDYLLGIAYSGMLDSATIACAMEDLDSEGLVEAVLHPCCYIKSKTDKYFQEFRITQDRALEDKIKRLGYDITNYKKCAG